MNKFFGKANNFYYERVNLSNNYLLFLFDELDSTMNVAKSLAIEYPSSNLAIIANYQTSGRGRLSRTWDGSSGNLYLSIVLSQGGYSIKDMQKVYQLSFVFSLSVKETIAALASQNGLKCDLQCKWPNDVFINSKKVSGVLTESAVIHKNEESVIDYLCVGIGVNVKSAPDNLNAISLSDIGLNTNKMDFFYLFLEYLKSNLNEFMNHGFFHDSHSLKARWMNNAYKLNQLVEVGKDDSKVVGIFRDIDENGSIVLEADNQIIKVNVGDVS